MKSPFSRAQRARLRLAYLRELSRFEKALQRKIAKVISVRGQTLAWYYENTHAIEKSQLHEHRDEFVGLLTEFYKRVGVTFAEKLSRSLKASVFEDALQAWIKEKALSTVEDIDDYTLDIVRNIIRRGVDGKLDVSAIARLIEDATDITNALPRARVIARTEMHDAMNFAQVEAAKATGLQLVKTWTSNLDNRTREAHVEADGQTVGLDEDFIVGGESISRPGEGSAANAVNCRCTLVFAEVAAINQ